MQVICIRDKSCFIIYVWISCNLKSSRKLGIQVLSETRNGVTENVNACLNIYEFAVVGLSLTSILVCAIEVSAIWNEDYNLPSVIGFEDL